MTVIRTAEEALRHLIPAHLSERIASALAAPIPLSTDLSHGDPYDQGQSNSCSCHALPKGVEIVSGFIGSMRGLYAATGTLDDGRTLTDVLHVARNVGLATFSGSVGGRYSDVPDPPNAVQSLPWGEATIKFDLGEHIISPQAPDLSDQLAASLAAGCPVYLATAVGTSFDNLTAGTVAQPDPTATAGHALLMVGHRVGASGEREFKICNSWGAWDENGECWVSLAWVRACWELHPLIYTPGKPAPGPTMLDRVRDVIRGVLPGLS